LAENLPGRGMWLKTNKESLQEAIKTGAFNKACQSNCSNMDDSFIAEVESLLKARVLNLLSMSKKSGDLTLGFEKVLEKVKNNQVKVFIIASDSGEDGKHKIEHKLDENILIMDKFTGAELQSAFGQDTVVVYGAVKQSKIAKSIVANYAKLLGFI
jgi:uncharacterized protein